MFHALMEYLDWSAHRTHDSTADNPLGQLQMMKAEQMDAFVKIEQPLGHLVQAKEFLVTALQFVHVDARLAQLSLESLPQPRTHVEQGKEPRRIQAAAVSEPGANLVVVIRRDRLQLVQH